MTVSDDPNERYKAGACIDCGLEPHSAGRPRCASCHTKYTQARNEGRAV